MHNVYRFKCGHVACGLIDDKSAVFQKMDLAHKATSSSLIVA